MPGDASLDLNRFDDLARVLSVGDSRRRVLGLVAALPVAGGLRALLAPEETDAAGRRKRRKNAHKPGKGRRHPKPKHKKKPPCTPESVAQTCAGQCGSRKNTCGKQVDCGPCAVCAVAGDDGKACAVVTGGNGVCAGGVCVSCGGAGELCCAGDACANFG
jgi:hypothetical protein